MHATILGGRGWQISKIQGCHGLQSEFQNGHDCTEKPYLQTNKQTPTSSFQVSEGPPLRLWRSTIEVPAAPEEILKRLLKEQHLWDVDLLDSKVIEILDSQTEIYQYVQNSMAPHPARDYVVLRWVPRWFDCDMDSQTSGLSPCTLKRTIWLQYSKPSVDVRDSEEQFESTFLFMSTVLRWVMFYLLELSSERERLFKWLCTEVLDVCCIEYRYSGWKQLMSG